MPKQRSYGDWAVRIVCVAVGGACGALALWFLQPANPPAPGPAAPVAAAGSSGGAAERDPAALQRPAPSRIRLHDVATERGLGTVVARAHFDLLQERIRRKCAEWEASTKLPARSEVIGVRACEIQDTTLMGFGAGLAVGDIDNDGDDDLYVAAPGPPGPLSRNRLFRNDGKAGFVDVTDASGTGGADWSAGAVFADVDGDGWLDLYVTNFGPNRLYRNRGDGTFAEVPDAGGTGDDVNSASATFADIDHDGDLDLFVANSSTFQPTGALPDEQYPFGLEGLQNALYRNRGDGTFDREYDPWATGRSRFISLGAVFFDVDGDGDQDLFVTNDGSTDELFANLGDGMFAYVNNQVGVFDQMAGMGIAIGDVNGDLQPDIFISHWEQEPDTLFLSPGRPFDLQDFKARTRYVNATCAAGLFEPSIGKVGWGALFVDLDLDGDLDLVQARSHAGGGDAEGMRQPNAAHENLGQARFRDVSEESGMNAGGGGISYGVATSDYDGDGDVDVFLSNLESPVLLLENRSQGGNGVTFRLRMRSGNRFAVGARVTIVAGGQRQVRQVLVGGSYLSGSATDLVFGLGAATEVETVLVRWPDRVAEETFGPFPAGRVHVIEPRQEHPLP